MGQGPHNPCHLDSRAHPTPPTLGLSHTSPGWLCGAVCAAWPRPVARAAHVDLSSHRQEMEGGRQAQPGGGSSCSCHHSSCHHCHSSCHHLLLVWPQIYITLETVLSKYFCHDPSACLLTSRIRSLLIALCESNLPGATTQHTTST